jgi:hypothetical protein
VGAGRAGSAPSGGGEPRLFEGLVKEDARTIATRADETARRLLLMLADVVRELAPIEGRKTLVLFSEGFYTDHVTRELEQVAAAAAQAYAVVYAIDLNRREGDLKEAEPVGDQHTEIESRLASLGSLAVETDGMLLTNAASDPGAALGRIADISQDYYLVGFEPVDASKRGVYRRVAVRVTRPGARVSTRTGYSLAESSATPADRRRAIDLAIAAPFAQQGLPIRYTTYVLGAESPGTQRVFVSLAADLPVASNGSDQRSADVVFVVRSVRDGRVVASGTDTIPMPTPASGSGTIGTSAYKVQFEAPPGEYLMRIVVREPGGSIGSADRRFDVRRLDTAGVAASDLVLGGATGSLPVRAVAYAGDALAGVVELYGRRAQDLETVTVTAQLESASARADLGEVRTRGHGSVSREARIALPLTGVAPGDYVVRAIVREGAETIAELAREVRVLPGSAPAAPGTPEETTPPTVSMAPIAPADVLGGEIAKRYVRELIEAARGSAMQEAAGHAARGAWSAVETALDSQPAPATDTTGTAPRSCGSPYYGLRGLARFSASRLDAAGNDLRLAAGDPPCALPSFILGWVHAAAGERRDAINAWRAAAFADPTLVPAHLAIAEAYVRAAEPALAIQALKTGLRAIPGSPELRERLAALEHR